LLAFLLRKAPLVVLSYDFFHFFFNNFLPQSHSEIRLLLSTCASLYCSHAKPIREDFREFQKQAKVTLPTGNHRTLPQRGKEKGDSKKMTKARFGLMPYISGF